MKKTSSNITRINGAALNQRKTAILGLIKKIRKRLRTMGNKIIDSNGVVRAQKFLIIDKIKMSLKAGVTLMTLYKLLRITI